MLPSLQRALSGRRPRQATQQQLYSDSEVGRWVCPAAAELALAPRRRSRAVAAAAAAACCSHCLLFPPTRLPPAHPPCLIEQGHGEPLHFETTAQHLARDLHASREEAARLQRQLAEAQRAAAAADAALRRLEQQQQQEQAAAARRQEEQSELLSSRAGEAEQRLQQSQQALQEVSGEGLNQFSGRKGLCGNTCPA